jgi:hypothetical protein
MGCERFGNCHRLHHQEFHSILTRLTEQEDFNERSALAEERTSLGCGEYLNFGFDSRSEHREFSNRRNSTESVTDSLKEKPLYK